MSNNTELLKSDPIGAFEQIKELYIRYLMSAYQTRFSNVEIQRENLLNTAGVSFQDPYVELLPEYKPYDSKIKDWKYEDFQDIYTMSLHISSSLISCFH